MTKPATRAGAGAPSILLILVVVCLTLFGVLALVAARNDAALTARTSAAAEAYYAADADAQRALASIDAWILSGMDGQPEGVTLARTGSEAAFSVESGDGHTLFVTLALEGGGFRVTGYRYENTEGWSADTQIDLGQ